MFPLALMSIPPCTWTARLPARWPWCPLGTSPRPPKDFFTFWPNDALLTQVPLSLPRPGTGLSSDELWLISGESELWKPGPGHGLCSLSLGSHRLWDCRETELGNTSTGHPHHLHTSSVWAGHSPCLIRAPKSLVERLWSSLDTHVHAQAERAIARPACPTERDRDNTLATAFPLTRQAGVLSAALGAL